MYDVIVVGAGPSGSVCARQLAAAEVRVLLVEKAQFPRLKLCGGGISHKCARLLEGIVDIRCCNPTPIVGSYLSYGTEHLVYAGQPDASYSVNRAEFDQLLLDAASAAGCTVEVPARITHAQESAAAVTISTDDGRTFQSQYLVLAEGANGALHRQLGYVGRREVTMALELDVVPRHFPERLRDNTLFDFGSIPGGYAWVFPKRGCLNVGAYWYRSRTLSPDQRQSLERFLRKFIWASDAEIHPVRGHPLPCHVDYRAYHTPRTLLVGDAAGTVENLFGEGIYYALSSGLLAAGVLVTVFRGRGDLDVYTDRLKADILKQIHYSRVAARILYSHQRFGYHHLVSNRLIGDLYTRVVRGDLSHRCALLRTLAVLPVSPLAGQMRCSPPSDVGLTGGIARSPRAVPLRPRGS